jgi:hypothetical protein
LSKPSSKARAPIDLSRQCHRGFEGLPDGVASNYAQFAALQQTNR